MTTFTEDIRRHLVTAGLDEAELVNALPEARGFGDTAAVFQLEPLLLRFTLDRGQTFIDIASSNAPDNYHQFDDVDIAMGWRTISEVLAKQEPENVGVILSRICANLKALREAFSGGREQLMHARVERAALSRGQAFADRLRERRS